jgi:hypothetical protein
MNILNSSSVRTIMKRKGTQHSVRIKAGRGQGTILPIIIIIIIISRPTLRLEPAEQFKWSNALV